MPRALLYNIFRTAKSRDRREKPMLNLEQMTPEQKIGRVLCARRFAEQDDIDFTLELVKNQACGCVQLPFNERTAELARLYREAADYPLRIINDMERGLPSSSLPKISLISLAACNNSDYTKAFAAAIAKEAKELILFRDLQKNNKGLRL